MPVTAGLAGSGGIVVIVGLLVWERKTRYATPGPVTPGSDAVLDPIPAETQPDKPVGVTTPLPSDEPTPGTEESPDGPTGNLGRINGLATTESLVAVRVLGPLQVEGLTGVLRRRPPLRVLILLAVAGDAGLTGDQLRNRLAEEEYGELSGPSLRSHVSRLRAVLPPGVLPDMSATGYRLDADRVSADWDQYRQLMTRAGRLDGPDRLDLAVRALGLVRGPVLEGATWYDVERTVTNIEIALEGDATATVALARQLGRVDLAGRAARQATMACPQVASLWQLRLEAAAAGSGEGLIGVWDKLGADIKDANPDLEHLYRRLRGKTQ